MSDAPIITQEHIDAAAARDERVRAVIDMEDLRGALADDTPLWRVMARLRVDAEAAMVEFATVNLGDQAALQDLQARVFRFQVASETFAMVLARGMAAKESIDGESADERRAQYEAQQDGE